MLVAFPFLVFVVLFAEFLWIGEFVANDGYYK